MHQQQPPPRNHVREINLSSVHLLTFDGCLHSTSLMVVNDLDLRSLQKVCKSHQAAAFDFVTTLMPSANC